MRFGNIIPQGTDSFHADVWMKIYENELTSAATSVTISGLDGNVDVMYRLICRVITNDPNSTLPEIFFNNDSSSNKGEQRIVGINTTVTSQRRVTDGVTLSYDAYTGSYISFAEIIIYAKSGYVRTCIVEGCAGISGTTVSEVYFNGGSWNDTSSNLTSIVINGYSNNFGVGTAIELWKPLAKV